MDISDMLGITVETVKASPTKKLVVVSPGAKIQTQDGKTKINMLVEMDGNKVPWMPNTTTLRNIGAKYGMLTEGWVGKVVALEIGLLGGREAVIGKPL